MESLLASRNRWVTLGLAAALVVALPVAIGWQRARAAQSQTAAPAGARGLGAVLDELTLALQGEPIAVRASPVLCYSGTALPPSAADPVQWYFGGEGCERTYAPRQGALVTSASEDLSKDYFAEKRTQDQVTGLLRELATLVRDSRLSPEEKLLVHSAAWEVAYGLKSIEELQPALAPALSPAACEAFRLVRLTYFTEAEAAALGSNLARLPAELHEPRFQSAARPLLGGEPGNLEVKIPTEVHAAQLMGRFTARIFLTVTDTKQREAFVSFATRASTPYEALRDLPQRYDGFQGILVLYFNVLTERWKTVPTGVVAGWQQYNFTKRSSFEAPMEAVAKNIEFLVVRAVREGTRLRYEVVDQAEMTRRAFLDVKPMFPEARVTSLRGHCLRCHKYSVATFDTHGARLVRLVEPFILPTKDLMGEAYGRREAKLATWARECQAAPAAGDPGRKSILSEAEAGGDGSRP